MTWLWWGSGKDGAWAFHRLSVGPRRVTALVTTVTDPFDRVAMHGVRAELPRTQAARLGLPVHEFRIPHPCTKVKGSSARGPTGRAS